MVTLDKLLGLAANFSGTGVGVGVGGIAVAVGDTDVGVSGIAVAVGDNGVTIAGIAVAIAGVVDDFAVATDLDVGVMVGLAMIVGVGIVDIVVFDACNGAIVIAE